MQAIQENIRGHVLELRIIRDTCDSGLFEEYIVQNKSRPHVRYLKPQILLIVIPLFSLAILSSLLQIYSAFFTAISIAALLSIILQSIFCVTTERVLYVPKIGIQQVTSYACGAQTPHFIPSTNIEDFIINEDIGWNHSFYLAVVLKECDAKHKLFPLFQSTKPRLHFLQETYNRMITLKKFSLS